jgi:hypothetical protein
MKTKLQAALSPTTWRMSILLSLMSFLSSNAASWWAYIGASTNVSISAYSSGHQPAYPTITWEGEGGGSLVFNTGPTGISASIDIYSEGYIAIDTRLAYGSTNLFVWAAGYAWSTWGWTGTPGMATPGTVHVTVDVFGSAATYGSGTSGPNFGESNVSSWAHTESYGQGSSSPNGVFGYGYGWADVWGQIDSGQNYIAADTYSEGDTTFIDWDVSVGSNIYDVWLEYTFGVDIIYTSASGISYLYAKVGADTFTDLSADNTGGGNSGYGQSFVSGSTYCFGTAAVDVSF